MNRRLQLAALAAAFVTATVATACGGTTLSRPSGTGTSGAALVASGALVYGTIDGNLGSSQWRQVDTLLKNFPVRTRLLAELRRGLAEHQLDYQRDLKHALGPEIDLAAAGGASTQETAYAIFTKPDSIENARALVRKLDEGSPPSATRVVDGWLVVADSEKMIDRVLKGSGSSLADDTRFKDAFGRLPGDALIKLYANGPELTKLVGSLYGAMPRRVSDYGGSSQTTAVGSNKLDWVALAAVAEDNGIKLEGDAKSTTGSNLAGAAYSSKLISGVPADTLAFATFHGRSGYDPLGRLRENPMFSQGLRQVEQELGISLDKVVALFQHETAFYVRGGPGLPEFSLVLEAPDTEQALTAIDGLGARVAKLAPARLGDEKQGGLDVKTLNFGPVTVRWAGFDGRVLLTTSPTGIADYRSSNDKLGDDSAFKDALSGAGAPDKTNGLVYVNVADAVPLIENYAGLAGGKLPAGLVPNLKPLRSFVAYGSSSGDRSSFAAFLEIK